MTDLFQGTAARGRTVPKRKFKQIWKILQIGVKIFKIEFKIYSREGKGKMRENPATCKDIMGRGFIPEMLKAETQKREIHPRIGFNHKEGQLMLSGREQNCLIGHTAGKKNCQGYLLQTESRLRPLYGSRSRIGLSTGNQSRKRRTTQFLKKSMSMAFLHATNDISNQISYKTQSYFLAFPPFFKDLLFLFSAECFP